MHPGVGVDRLDHPAGARVHHQRRVLLGLRRRPRTAYKQTARIIPRDTVWIITASGARGALPRVCRKR